jgi:hypothetical protein
VDLSRHHVLILPVPGQGRVNPSHYGSDEQVFGAKQQGLRGTSVRRRFDQSSGLGIQKRYGPDHEVVLATIEHTIYTGAARFRQVRGAFLATRVAGSK